MAIDQLTKDGFLTTTVDAAISWAQRNSLWPMPMGISCCAIEMMAFAGPRFDSARFGSEKFGFTPRQSDLLIVAGTVTYKMSWVVRKIWDQMPEPKWCISMGVCASSGGMFRSYSVVQGIEVLPLTESFNGYVEFYCNNQPTEDFNVTILVRI